MALGLSTLISATSELLGSFSGSLSRRPRDTGFCSQFYATLLLVQSCASFMSLIPPLRVSQIVSSFSGGTWHEQAAGNRQDGAGCSLGKDKNGGCLSPHSPVQGTI